MKLVKSDAGPGKPQGVGLIEITSLSAGLGGGSRPSRAADRA